MELMIVNTCARIAVSYVIDCHSANQSRKLENKFNFQQHAATVYKLGKFIQLHADLNRLQQ